MEQQRNHAWRGPKPVRHSRVGLHDSRHARSLAGHESSDRAIDVLKYRDLIQACIGTDTRWNADDILLALVQGRMQLFADEYGIVITQILNTRDRRLLVFLLSGEKMHLWKDRMTKRLIDFARQQQCCLIEAWCRPGLEGQLKDLGWKREEVVLRIRL